MKTYLILIAFTIPLIAFGQEKLEFQVKDGEIVIVRTPTYNSTSPPGNSPPPTSLNVPNANGINKIYEVGRTVAIHVEEGDNLALTRKRAQENAKAAIESGYSYAIVPVTGNEPYELTPQKVHEYTVEPADVGNNLYEVLSDAFVSKDTQIIPADGKPKYLKYMVFAEKNERGEVVFSNLTSTDHERFIIYTSEKSEQENKALAQKLESDRLQDEKRYKALIEEQKAKDKKAYEEEQESLRIKAADADKRAKEEEERRKTLAARSKERDDACAGGRSPACIYKDDQVTNDFAEAYKRSHTALCRADGDRGALGMGRGGCAPGSPPCISCSAGKDLDEQRRLETLFAAELSISAELLDKGYNEAQIDTAITKFLNSNEGLNHFELRGLKALPKR